MSADEAFDNLMRQNAIPIPKGRHDSVAIPKPSASVPADGAVRVTDVFDGRDPDYRPRPAGQTSSGGGAHPTESFLEPAGEAELDRAIRQGARVMGRDTEIRMAIRDADQGADRNTDMRERTRASDRNTVIRDSTKMRMNAAGDAGRGGEERNTSRIVDRRKTRAHDTEIREIVGDTKIRMVTRPTRHSAGEDTVAELSAADLAAVAGVEDETARPGSSRVRGLAKARRTPRFGYLPLSGVDAFESGARDLAIRLAAAAPGKPSLAVTSALRGEGRTEIAIRLALAVAKRVGSRVLLVDFDIKKPQIAQRLGASTKYFVLQDVLAGACPLAEAVVMGEEDNLFVLPARASERDGDEILDGRHAAALLEDVHASFDFAILDCGPVGHADAMAVCLAAGAAALAGYCRVTRASSMNKAAARLAAAGANVAGMILAGGPA